MLKSLLGLASPAGDGGRLSTLIFHRVLAEPDPLFPQEVDRPRFDLICGWIRHWFNVLPLDEAAARLKERTLPPRAMAITFDDGYEDNASVALPVLQRHGLPATFFVATGFLDGGRMWNDTVIEAIRRTAKATLDLRDVSAGSFGSYDVATAEAKRSAIGHILLKAKYLPPAERQAFGETLARLAGATLPTNLMMSTRQVRLLADSGMQVGAHTVSHPILARLGDEQAYAEIERSKSFLEERLDKPVTLFAYPNGKPGIDYGPAAVAGARTAGFAAAMSTAWGAAGPDSEIFQLPRFTPWDRSRLRFGARLLANLRSRPVLSS